MHLTAVRLLAPHCETRITCAPRRGDPQIPAGVVQLLAGWFPTADVPSTVLKSPSRTEPALVRVLARSPARGARHRRMGSPAAAERDRRPWWRRCRRNDTDCRSPSTSSARRSPAPPEPMRRDIPERGPGSDRRLGRSRSSGEEVEKKAFAGKPAPRESRPAHSPHRGTSPPHVERAVWNRNQGQCAFEGARSRCPERPFLQFHHLTPRAVGGAAVGGEHRAALPGPQRVRDGRSTSAPIRAAMEVTASSVDQSIG